MISHEIDISHQRARQIKAKDLDEFDFIFSLDTSVHNEIAQRFKTHPNLNRIKQLLPFLSLGTDVYDPYFGGADGFESVYQVLDQATRDLLIKLTS